MRSKNIVFGVIVAAAVNTASAGSLSTTEMEVSAKQAQANVLSDVFGSVVQTVNSPECTGPVPIFFES